MDVNSLIPIFMGLTVFMLAMGLYQTFFAKAVHARDRFDSTLGVDPKQARLQEIRQRHNETILKQRESVKAGESPTDKTLALEMKLERANLLIKPSEYRLIQLGIALVTALLGWLMGGHWLWGVLSFVVGMQIFGWFVGFKTMLRMAKAQEQFSNVLDSMVGCLKTGLGFGQSVNTVTENFDDPWGTEFGKMAVENSMGIPQSESLDNLYNRMPNPDVEMFVTAMQIYGETGGNLVELLNNLSTTIRTRYKLLRKVKTLSAQGKLSAGIIICVPFVIAGIMYATSPGPTTEFVTNPIGMVILGLTAIWMGIGVVVLFKIVQIEV
jgi:tight adherence protein B